MARKKAESPKPNETTENAVVSYKHSAKRKNIPPAGLESHGKLQDTPKIRYEYNPHLPPSLRSAPEAQKTDQLLALLRNALVRTLGQPAERKLIDEATERQLTEAEVAQIKTIFEAAITPEAAQYLATALRHHEPWLEWSSKREKPWFEVEPVALHMHERVSTQAILRVLARQDVQRDMFADPQLDYAKAVQFYQVDVDWANRMILGDSLQIMASLARREDLAGRVQMIYFDPPYGIKFASNFQPQLGQRDVKDREQDLTREPEMVKAYRDTWTLGIHSYLAYLRDRLTMSRELLADTGSIFVQISDENLHRVRCVLDEVFGPDNFCCLIPFATTGGQSADLLGNVFDFLLWYSKDKTKLKYRQLYGDKGIREGGGWAHSRAELPDGTRQNIGVDEVKRKIAAGEKIRPYSQDGIASQGATATGSAALDFQGRTFQCPSNSHWKTDTEGMIRLGRAGRIETSDNSLRFVRFLDDFPVQPITNLWDDTNRAGYIDEKRYVVQTSAKVIERCLLMTTDPGDLVLDPTCGSGTTAFVAEQWGRRWITCDSSRVALALAKHRLLTSKFDYYRLRELNAEDLNRNPKGTWIAEFDNEGHATGKKLTFECNSVPHITLKSIARNTSLDPVFSKHEPVVAESLKHLNREVAKISTAQKEKLVEKLIKKHREHGASAITEADVRRWLLPDTHPTLVRNVPASKPFKGLTPKQAENYRTAIPAGKWHEWEVPFDSDPEWPKPLQEALVAYRAAWRAKMDDINAVIRANAVMEELVDKPEPVSGVVRVSGPFTMEGVIAVEDGPDSPIGGAPEKLDAFGGDTADLAVANAEAHLDKILRLLKASGVDFPGNKNMKFNRLDPLTGASLIHADGEWINGDKRERRVAVTIGPEIGNLTSMQVEDVIRSANRRGYDDVVFAAFGFDAASQDIIESESHPKLRLHMALIRPDVAMGDLLKSQPGSQLFNVFSAPRVKMPEKLKDGQFIVEVEGMDVYDPVNNAVFPSEKTGNDCVAAWFLDTDYDGRTFCICQAFFPDKGKWDKLAKALGDKGVVDEDAFAALSGWRSLPFPRPVHLAKGQKWQVGVKVLDSRGNEGLRVLTLE